MAGRKNKPTHLKIVSGNPGKRKLNKNEPTASSDSPIAPEWLSDIAKQRFADIVAILDEMGYASKSHVHMLALAADTLAEWQECSEVIEEEGRTYETTNQQGDTMTRARPEVAMRNEAKRHAQSLLAEFGLSASSATKIVVPGKQKKNAFNDL